MIASRIAKKVAGGRHFVKKSARLSIVLTYGTSISKFSTHSRTKKCLRAMCFTLLWYSGLYFVGQVPSGRIICCQVDGLVGTHTQFIEKTSTRSTTPRAKCGASWPTASLCAHFWSDRQPVRPLLVRPPGESGPTASLCAHFRSDRQPVHPLCQ